MKDRHIYGGRKCGGGEVVVTECKVGEREGFEARKKVMTRIDVGNFLFQRVRMKKNMGKWKFFA